MNEYHVFLIKKETETRMKNGKMSARIISELGFITLLLTMYYLQLLEPKSVVWESCNYLAMMHELLEASAELLEDVQGSHELIGQVDFKDGLSI